MLLLVPLCSWTNLAQAFPQNPVLDTFTGCDGMAPAAAYWTNAVVCGATSANCHFQNNAAATASNGVEADCYWKVAS